MTCNICQNQLSPERQDAIKSLGLEEICVSCSELHTKKIKGFYQGISGISNLNLVKNLGREEHLVPISTQEEIDYEEYDNLPQTD